MRCSSSRRSRVLPAGIAPRKRCQPTPASFSMCARDAGAASSRAIAVYFAPLATCLALPSRTHGQRLRNRTAANNFFVASCSDGRAFHICVHAHRRKRYKAVNVIAILSVLAEPTRLEALRLLWDGRERCVCELMQELGASQSRMSRHMAALKTAGLVVDRRDAQWVRYRRAPNLPQEVTTLIDAALAIPVTQERHAA
jgi:ArsR family transcriptional regulator